MGRLTMGIVTVIAALAIGASAASASDVPCSKLSAGKYQCSFYPAGDGISAGAPVQDSTGKRVGYLNHGANWIVCQASGATVHNGADYNRWWGYTEANDQHIGWVNAVWGSGGSNDGPFATIVPNCGSTYGSPPVAAAPAPSPTPLPTPTPTPPSAPNPVPCHSIGGGKHQCFFYTAGDGIHGGTPVFVGSKRVGYLNHGSNWVLCQQQGAQFGVGNGTVNVWWAWTEADNHKLGWVNAVFGRGGTNNGQFQGVPNCNGTHGYPPGASAPKPKPKPKPLPKNMVALGDSYSSGEGTDPNTGLPCIRSNQAYGYLVASALGYRMTGFEACAGATTSSVLNDQLPAVNSSTTLVTMSVGGDDADFAGVLGRCAGGLGVVTGPCKNMIKKESGIIRTQLPGRLDGLYSAIGTDAPHAKVVIVGYPYLFYGACDKSAPLQWLNPPTDLLDNTIKAAAQRHGFTFVDLRGPFKGHSACDEGAWINHLYTHDIYKSFHLDAAGYREVAKLIEAAL
jgi:lysophospholipase L1-like esterase